MGVSEAAGSGGGGGDLAPLSSAGCGSLVAGRWSAARTSATVKGNVGSVCWRKAVRRGAGSGASSGSSVSTARSGSATERMSLLPKRNVALLMSNTAARNRRAMALANSAAGG